MDEETQEEVEEIAEEISKQLNLGDLKRKIDKLTGDDGNENVVAKKIYNYKDVVNADVDTLSKDEKIVGFFQALCRNDIPTIKALSEGVAARFFLNGIRGLCKLLFKKTVNSVNVLRRIILSQALPEMA